MFIALILVFVLVVLIVVDIYIRVKLQGEDDQKKVLTLLEKINNIVLSSITDLETVAQQVSDAVAFDLGFKVGVILLIDEKREVLRRVAVSRTERVKTAVMELGVDFKGLETPLYMKENLPVQVATDGIARKTESVYDLLKPHFTKEQADYIQKVGELSSSMVYPLLGKNRKIGVMIISLSEHWQNLDEVQKKLIQKVIDVVGIALDNAMLYENLDTVSKQLEKANMKLMELDKLKDDFVSVASHELRTPMAAIKSYSWMALHRSGIKLPDNLEKYLIRVLLSTERLINLVNDMLNISRIESGKIEINSESVDIIQLVKDVVDETYYSKGLEKDVHFAILEEKLPPVLADPEKLRQVMLNIVGNGVKFVPNGGMITISFFTDGKVVEVSVKDTGPGIAKDDLGKLFTKFGRLDNTYSALSTSGGTGLGLYISKSLIELMHGKIWAKSEGLGKGATFTISLPVASKAVLQDIEKYRVIAKDEAKGLEPVAL